MASSQVRLVVLVRLSVYRSLCGWYVDSLFLPGLRADASQFASASTVLRNRDRFSFILIHRDRFSSSSEQPELCVDAENGTLSVVRVRIQSARKTIFGGDLKI